MMRHSLPPLVCIWIAAALPPPAWQLQDDTELLQTSTGLSDAGTLQSIEDVGNSIQSVEAGEAQRYGRLATLVNEVTISEQASEKLRKAMWGMPMRENNGTTTAKSGVSAEEIKALQREMRTTMQNLSFPTHALLELEKRHPNLGWVHENSDSVREMLAVANEQWNRNTGLHEYIESLVPRMAAIAGDQAIANSLNFTLVRSSNGFTTPPNYSLDALADEIPNFLSLEATIMQRMGLQAPEQKKPDQFEALENDVEKILADRPPYDSDAKLSGAFGLSYHIAPWCKLGLKAKIAFKFMPAFTKKKYKDGKPYGFAGVKVQLTFGVSYVKETISVSVSASPATTSADLMKNINKGQFFYKWKFLNAIAMSVGVSFAPTSKSGTCENLKTFWSWDGGVSLAGKFLKTGILGFNGAVTAGFSWDSTYKKWSVPLAFSAGFMWPNQGWARFASFDLAGKIEDDGAKWTVLGGSWNFDANTASLGKKAFELQGEAEQGAIAKAYNNKVQQVKELTEKLKQAEAVDGKDDERSIVEVAADSGPPAEPEVAQ